MPSGGSWSGDCSGSTAAWELRALLGPARARGFGASMMIGAGDLSRLVCCLWRAVSRKAGQLNVILRGRFTMDVPSRGGGEREQEDFVGVARREGGVEGRRAAVASLLVVGGQARHWTAAGQHHHGSGRERGRGSHCHPLANPLKYSSLGQSLSRESPEDWSPGQVFF